MINKVPAFLRAFFGHLIAFGVFYWDTGQFPCHPKRLFKRPTQQEGDNRVTVFRQQCIYEE